MLDRMSDALSLLAVPLIEAAGRLGSPDVAAVLERPADPEHGDYATTLALRLAKPLRRAPRELAEELATAARASPWVESADVAGPGFVNVRVSPAWYAEAVRLAREPGYGGGTASPPLRVNVEYVSANPTGPLPVSAGRNAAYGDSLARLFAFAGHEVVREYYFNDSGSQIERFGLSLRARARGEPVPEDGYQGEALIELAKQTGLPPDASAEEFGRAGVKLMFAAIRATLERFRVQMDVYTNEVDLHRSGGVERALALAGQPATCSNRTARRGFGRASSATTRTARSSSPTARRRTSPAISRTSWTSSSAASTSRSTSSAPTTMATPRGSVRPPRPSATTRRASRSRSTRWCI